MTSFRRTVATVVLIAFSIVPSACQRSAVEPRSVRPDPTSAVPRSDPHAMPARHPSVGTGTQHAWPGGSAAPAPAEAPADPTVTWDDPSGWQRVTPSSPMRRAQYRIPHTGADTQDAELTVITFGPGQGGNTEANLDRWYGQVTQPDGRDTRAIAVRREITVGSITVTITEVPGRIGGGGGGAMPGAPAGPTFEHGRLLAAIAQVGDGPWFFKMLGPDATVAAARPAFEAMLRSLRVETR